MQVFQSSLTVYFQQRLQCDEHNTAKAPKQFYLSSIFIQGLSVNSHLRAPYEYDSRRVFPRRDQLWRSGAHAHTARVQPSIRHNFEFPRDSVHNEHPLIGRVFALACRKTPSEWTTPSKTLGVIRGTLFLCKAALLHLRSAAVIQSADQ